MIIGLLVFLFVFPVPIGSLTVNDIACLLVSPITIVSLFKFKRNYYSHMFCSTNAFNVIIVATLSLLTISFFHFLLSFGMDSVVNNLIRFIRGASFALYLLGSLFVTRFILPDSSRTYQSNSKRLLELIYSLIILSGISLIYSLITSCAGATYGAKFCIIGTASYSANGYIALFSMYSLLLSYLLYSLLNNDSRPVSPPLKLNFLLTCSSLIYIVIAVNSGSRGAVLCLASGLLSIGLFFAWRIICSLKLRLTLKSLLSISALLLPFSFLISFGYRSLRLFYALFYDNSLIISSVYSRRFERTEALSNVDMLFGNGNFSLAKLSTGVSFFDGTLQYFYISFGIVGLCILLMFVFAAVSAMIVCLKKFLDPGQAKAKVLIHALPFASVLSILVSSFPNELGTLNSIAPFYFLVLFLSGYLIKFSFSTIL